MKEALVIVPGLSNKTKGTMLETVVDEMLHCSAVNTSRVGEVNVGGNKGVQIKTEGNNQKTMDVYEAFWEDLIPTLSNQKPTQKVFKGFFLLFYWFFSKVWAAAIKSKFLLFGVLFSSLLLCLWYCGIFSLACKTIAAGESIAGVKMNDLPVFLRDWIKIFMNGVDYLVNAMPIVVILMGILPLNSLVDMVYCAKQYLQNNLVSSDDRIGVRSKMHHRVLDTLKDIFDQGNYDRITVLAHSFGVAISTDVLADFSRGKTNSIRYLSMGSPLALLSCRSEWVGHQIQKCVQNPMISVWVDYYLTTDWLCAKTPNPPNSPKLESKPIEMKTSLWDRLWGNTHFMYISEQTIINDIVVK